MNGPVAFLGAGNMAEALVHGIIKSKVLKPDQMIMADIRKDRLNELAERYGVQVTADNVKAVERAGIVVFAVKPQQMGGVLNEIKDVAGQKCFISIAAGVTTRRIEDELAAGVRVIRCMPNTPALVGQGAAAICSGAHADECDLDVAEALLSASSCVVRVDEEQINAVTALSGSGPAYVFYLMEAMIEAGEKMGLHPDVVRTLTLATVAGAASLAEQSEEDPATLRARVTSKGGTTEAALNILEGADVKESIISAMERAKARGDELAGA